MEAENIQKCMAIQATLSGKNLEVTHPPLPLLLAHLGPVSRFLLALSSTIGD
jgi:hypothetical protein